MLCLHERIELPASGMKGLKFEVSSCCFRLRCNVLRKLLACC